jgi:aspartyl/asparaginyl beta-hydroxylase (cupin superfamily)
LGAHRGWAEYSNYVLRCHYGIKVPQKCFVHVSDDPNNNINNYDKCQTKNGKWIVFDDAKSHYASNNSDENRIILIIDIERPNWVKKGTSELGDTKELLQLIEYYKSKNQLTK